MNCIFDKNIPMLYILFLLIELWLQEGMSLLLEVHAKVLRDRGA